MKKATIRKSAAKKAAKRAPAKKKPDLLGSLRQALMSEEVPVLVDAIIDMARRDQALQRELIERFKVELPTDDLIEQTGIAIADATDFDERQINRNFSFDYDAYETVKRNFARLIEAGQIEDVMDLSLVLMRDGSLQVEMSDEGLMSNEIEECLGVVVEGLKMSDLPSKKIVDWCSAMMQADRVGCLFERELLALRKLQTS